MDVAYSNFSDVFGLRSHIQRQSFRWQLRLRTEILIQCNRAVAVESSMRLCTVNPYEYTGYILMLSRTTASNFSAIYVNAGL